jgi:hypothetical protein
VSSVSAAAAALLILGHACLVVVSLRHRSVLAVVVGGSGSALAVSWILSGSTGPLGNDALLVSAMLLFIGAVLLGLGQALRRLLDRPDRD